MLIVDDPDAPDPQAPRMTWVHRVRYNLPPAAAELKEGIRPAEPPKGTLEGLNDERGMKKSRRSCPVQS